ncbi:hypothetical protein [Cerasicoccus arenae]|uniref:Uncharacterized protein n=1 Tax=Cerasicoccus arenae TaxID=424488 RepID=A0A8J3DCQ4_9BACT|nr:hypothetical protein [Cerasicoccus arenae]MBK1858564.1 hypothetical protein [Cerasicoccus arenae]GHC06325.1 hypothetical protein GCM10007047_24300 [Cerasicoccus arenae]
MKKLNLYQSGSGSMLIAAIIFAMVAFMMLGTVLPSYLTDYRTSVRNRLLSSAFALAEAGGEEAIWSAYQNGWDVDAWKADADWKAITGADGETYYVRRVYFPNVSLGGTYTGYAKVAIKEPVRGESMEVVAQGIIIDEKGNDYINQIVQVDTNMLKPFVGFVSEDTLDLGSGTTVSATNTDNFPTIAEALADRDSNGVVGSLSTSSNSVQLANSNQKTPANVSAFQIGTVITGASVFSDAVSYSGTVLNQTSNYTASFPSIEHPSASGNNGPTSF